MTYSSPITAASGLVLSNLAPKITSFADVKQWCLNTKKATYAKAIDRLSRVAHNTPLSGIEATEVTLELVLPRSSKWKANPYPSEFKTDKAYKDYRRKVQAAFRGATSSPVPTTSRPSEQDAWAGLLTDLSHVIASDGQNVRQRLICFHRLSDYCRRLAINPSDLASEEAILRLDQELINTRRRKTLQRALNYLRNKGQAVPGIARHLPKEPVLTLDFARKTLNNVPSHLDAELAAWITKAGVEGYDETSERYIKEWSQQTRERYRAAFRHFLTTLGQEGVNTHNAKSIVDLANPANMNRWIDTVTDGQSVPGVIRLGSLFKYSSDILVLLGRMGYDVRDIRRTIKGSGKLRKGRAVNHKMAESVREF